MRIETGKFSQLILGGACFLMAGCASTEAPEHWLSPAENAPQDPYGAWMTVEFPRSAPRKSLSGEFLAVDRDSVYLLVDAMAATDPVVGIDLAKIWRASLAHFDPQTEKAGGWVVAGSISTLSHGWFLIASLPVWIIAGSTMAGSLSHSPLENSRDRTWDELAKYARFPQGPPPHIHELGLRPKMPVNLRPPPGERPIPDVW